MGVKGTGRGSDEEMGIPCLPLEAVLFCSKFLLLRLQRQKESGYYFFIFLGVFLLLLINMEGSRKL